MLSSIHQEKKEEEEEEKRLFRASRMFVFLSELRCVNYSRGSCSDIGIACTQLRRFARARK